MVRKDNGDDNDDTGNSNKNNHITHSNNIGAAIGVISKAKYPQLPCLLC